MEQLDRLTEYFQRLKHALVCPSAHRRRFLAEARRMAEDYCHGNPGASPEDVCAFLGAPEELAQTYLETLPPSVLTRYQQGRRRLHQVMISSMLILILILGGWVCYIKSTPLEVTVVETLVIYPPIEK